MSEQVKSISEKIKYVRQDRGMSQAELAECINVGKSAIANYETGYSIPTINILEKLAKALEVTVECLTDPNAKVNLNEPCMYFLKSTKIPIFEPAIYQKIMDDDTDGIKGHIEIPNCINVRNGYFFALIASDNNLDNCKIKKGDYIIVKRFSEFLEREELLERMIDGKIYIFEHENKVYTRKLLKNRDCFTVLCDSILNSERPYDVKMNDVKIIGECIKALVDL